MEHTIAQHLAIALLNDDWSGLCGSDCIALEQWAEGKGWIQPLEMVDTNWSRCEATGYHADTVTLWESRD